MYDSLATAGQEQEKSEAFRESTILGSERKTRENVGSEWGKGFTKVLRLEGGTVGGSIKR